VGSWQKTPTWTLQVASIPHEEKKPAFGSFAFSKIGRHIPAGSCTTLQEYIGSGEHRLMMKGFGFDEADIVAVTSFKQPPTTSTPSRRVVSTPGAEARRVGSTA
jgi:polar amino acid transport system substrate-binding protein